MVGRRFFRPMFRTKSKNFPALESLMKQKIRPRNVLGHFMTNIRPKCFDGTGPRLWFSVSFFGIRVSVTFHLMCVQIIGKVIRPFHCI